VSRAWRGGWVGTQMGQGRGWRVAALVSGLVLAVQLVVPAGSASGTAQDAAPDGPGALSHFGLARKDCLGTARNRTSKVWYTVADGVLSDVYYPTVDNTNVETLQFVVTDGATFTDLQARDMVSHARALDPTGMACRVVSTARNGRYRLVTDYLTDPRRHTVVLRVSFEPVVGRRGDYDVYVRLDPTVNGNGGGGTGNGGGDSGTVDTSTGQPIPVAFDTETTTNAANRDYAQPVFVALRPSTPFTQVSNGFAGTDSDGLVQLERDRKLTAIYDRADNGNLVQTAALDVTRRDTTLALGFGATQADAVTAADRSLSESRVTLHARYLSEWLRYDAGLMPPKYLQSASRTQRAELLRVWYVSANVLKASEDKTFPGAIVASLASPWGQAVSAGDPANTYFGSYREVFARDLYETFTGLLVAGDLATARDAVRFLFERQQLPDGSMPRNSLVNGRTAPDSFGVQLDETAYPLLMALQADLTNAEFYQAHIRPAANFVASRGPAFGVERWEEQSGWSPSTIASEIAGLLAAAEIAQRNGDHARARVWRGVADDFQRSVKDWTVTATGPLASHPYFIRLSKTGDPDAAISYNLGNGGPTLDQREVVDAGFLELTRLGVLAADDPDVVRSLDVVDATIRRETAGAAGWYRYNGDGYGDRASDGRPWAPTGQGNGHLWPVLAGERGEHALARGDRAGAVELLAALGRTAHGVGLIPEQLWELGDLPPSPPGTPPEEASIGFANGEAAGSATPLTWSAAQYVRLAADISAGRVLEQPQVTVERYVRRTQRATVLRVDEPADVGTVERSPVRVSGAAEPGATVDVAVTNLDEPAPTTVATTVAGPDGAWTVLVPVSGGTNVLDVVATASDGATAHARRTVVLDVVGGTLLLDVADPDGDDHGPGNYAYPTSDDFRDGAFDLQRFQVFDSGDRVVFRVQVRDLTPTFGSPLGAQLVDVYVHDPAAAPTDTSTAASFPQRNHQIAPVGAWSRLIEVQGFGQRYVDAGGATLGTVDIRANAISRTITFSVSKDTLGQPGPGWAFTVVFTGQDGFSPDQARGFAPTPQDFQFGVCATASDDPHCTVDPGTVPKALDVITPEGVSQADELDYTVRQPVVLQPVAIP
jgi:glucan 1,4-alpha-glucosidase